MNSNTKEDLKAFIDAVIDLGYAVSSFAGTNVLEELVIKGNDLKKRLDKDETII